MAAPNPPLPDINLLGIGSGLETPQPFVRNPFTDTDIYRIDIDFSEEGAPRCSHEHLRYIINHNSSSEWSLAHLREVHIEGEYFLGDLSLVEQTFDKLENLMKVVWDCSGPISIPIIRALEKIVRYANYTILFPTVPLMK